MKKKELIEVIKSLLLYKYKAARLSDFCDILGLRHKGRTKAAMLVDLTDHLVEYIQKARDDTIKCRGKYIAEWGILLQICGSDMFTNLEIDTRDYWNLTEMCRSLLTQIPTDEVFADWYNDEKTKIYLNLIAEHLSQPLESLIDSEDLRKREPKEDIFGHAYIAMRLAEYIHPQFESWLYLEHLRDSRDAQLLCLKSYVEKARLLEDELKGKYRIKEYESTPKPNPPLRSTL